MLAFSVHFPDGETMFSIHPLPRCFPHGLCLWGDGRIEELGRAFRRSEAQPQLATYAVVIIVPLAACLLGILIHRIASRPRRISHSLPALTRELYRMHRVGVRQRRLLEDIAQAAGIGEPAALMVVPATFDTAIEAALPRLKLSARDRAALDALRNRLFGSPVTERAPVDPSPPIDHFR